MKKLFIPFLFLTILLSGCNFGNKTETPSNNEQSSIGYGKMTFRFESSSERSVIPAETAQGLTDTYQVIIYNSDSSYKEVITDDSCIALQEGTYNAVLLAKKTSDWNKTHVYGSSYVQDISIVEGEVTEVNFLILPFDISFTCPATVKPGSSFNITKTVDTRNEVLFSSFLFKYDNFGSSMDLTGTPYVTGVPSELASFNKAKLVRNGTVLTYTYSYVAGSNPEEDTDYTITDTEKYLCSLKIYDSTYGFEKEDNDLDWPCYGGYTTDFAIENMSYCNITLKHVVDTGIGGTITWGE